MGIGVRLTYNQAQEDGEQTAREIQSTGGFAEALQLDVSVTLSLDDFLSRVKALLQGRFGSAKIDFLIKNAGLGKAIPIANLTEADFDSFVDVHFKGVVFLTQKALAMMNDGGIYV